MQVERCSSLSCLGSIRCMFIPTHGCTCKAGWRPPPARPPAASNDSTRCRWCARAAQTCPACLQCVVGQQVSARPVHCSWTGRRPVHAHTPASRRAHGPPTSWHRLSGRSWRMPCGHQSPGSSLCCWAPACPRRQPWYGTHRVSHRYTCCGVHARREDQAEGCPS